MIDSAFPSETHPLAELAEVTREYATYSRTAYGLAFVGTGALILALNAMDVAWRAAWMRPAYLIVTPAWLLLVLAARRRYQRHGVVVEAEPRLRHRGWWLALVWFFCAGEAYVRMGRLMREDGSWVVAALVVLGAVAVPLLVAEIARGKRDVVVAVALLIFAANVARPSSTPDQPLNPEELFRFLTLFMATVAAAWMVVVGVRQHARYRRLERRLAVLKARSP